VNGSAIVGGVALLIGGGVLVATGACGGKILPYVLIFMGVVSIIKGLLGVRDSTD
jgi:hypothetical protein